VSPALRWVDCGRPVDTHPAALPPSLGGVGRDQKGWDEVGEITRPLTLGVEPIYVEFRKTFNTVLHSVLLEEPWFGWVWASLDEERGGWPSTESGGEES